ncbi:type III-B CRISPR module RAMP protein Cmr6 [Meiothermus rufus]|uniref:type III-B CRISPR module RAMP protein Cmr6 n=1 Tax=Meiothermus rufus TaxID=604332 RepID=UPI00040214B3|nr:type III-B CRISPR module RAMP protein Cmr6 [Meiothermus rufus]
MRAHLPKTPPSHAGLALQRYLPALGDEGRAARALLEGIQDSPISPDYRGFFERWKEALEGMGAVFLEATTRTPLAIGLGNKSPLENGLAIHHTYGVPYLPGSAIKGLLRRAADKSNLSKEQKDVLFGEEPDPKRKSQGSAAHLVYWDGWLDPTSSQPFQKDVITVHHPGYYAGGKTWPTDFDDPNPVAFLSVRPGVKFHLALSSPDPEATSWLHLAAELLQYGLQHLGLGGKTNAGYGYFTLKLPERPKSQAEQGEALYQTYRLRIERINGRNAAGEASWFKQELSKHPPAVRRKTLEALLKQLEDWRLQKEAYYQSLKQLLEEA